MRLFDTRRRKIIGAAAGLGLAGTAGYAVADAGTTANRVETFYAQAAVFASANGTINLQHNTETVTRASLGRYCVKVTADANIDVPKTIPVVTEHTSVGDAWAIATPTSQCGNAADTYFVQTHDGQGQLADRAFKLLVP
ncbi:hypothetical protein AB0I00_41190 [Streptomyces sp. NPDC050803]|uniref:hypothetical protein n=1 Tax=unclassified Streptomyces TaxID=2593676 RepID=UPI00344152F8